MESNKVKAFTVGELIIVLILTSVVVGLAFTVLGLVQKQMIAIQSNYNKSTELNKLQTSLWIDINRYSEVIYNQTEEELVFKHELDSVSYTFYEDYIIKEEDTLNIRIENKAFYFNGDLSKTKEIDAIKLTTSKEFLNRQLFIFKQNAASAFMK